ncbi:hypothetical protein TPA0910_00240 [Streptomyces hygroscopicus subsp. sporocinereus]|uniref:Uncharacterized protein n=1 Tax=Streptomyces hygroscopicus TaxID=1912 RepID=A0ABQ3TQG9_STRHY|nr:hypothetical protein TPA0910_00240 [Streptomyces hygroscopicus]
MPHVHQEPQPDKQPDKQPDNTTKDPRMTRSAPLDGDARPSRTTMPAERVRELLGRTAQGD